MVLSSRIQQRPSLAVACWIYVAFARTDPIVVGNLKGCKNASS